MQDEHVAEICEAIKALAHGRTVGPPGVHLEPTGFEALVMALIGNSGSFERDKSIAYALNRIAEGLYEVSEAINNAKG